MREKLFNIIQPAEDNESTLSAAYDWFMMVVIVMSLVPLAFKNNNTGVLANIDTVCVVIFIIDYIARWSTADIQLKRGALSFLIYPFTPMAILDLLCILPSLKLLDNVFRILKIFRLFRTMRVFRAFKMIRYSKSIHVLAQVIKEERAPLLTVCGLAVGYVIIAALVIFNVEPGTFPSFFDAIYWAVVSLTTMGYGDIYPVTMAGQVITMLSAFIGIAIIALPSGIITSGYMSEITKEEVEEIEENPPKESSAQQIREFRQLLEEGSITQEEYDAKKTQLLGV